MVCAEHMIAALMKTPTDRANLRDALIDAGVEQLREGGAEGLSIRKVAARLGVSHAAPGYYFRTLADLRTAIATRAFRMLTASMREELARAPDAPRDRILAACRGYIRFAAKEPALYHLIFGEADRDPKDEERTEAGEAAYGVLQEICAPISPSPESALRNEIFIWSLVHGFANLMLSHHDHFIDGGSPEALFAQIFQKLEILE